jgi:hypothetical protein
VKETRRKIFPEGGKIEKREERRMNPH